MTCARCGAGDCEAEWGRKEAIACLERQLSNQAALLRSVTGKLEEAATRLTNVTPEAATQVAIALGLIDGVLEVLS